MSIPSEPGPSAGTWPLKVQSSLRFPVVGIGASAGGVTALSTFFSGMPSDTGMAFVVILHLSPEHESHVDSILQRHTRMPVLQVTEPAPVEPDRVYVIPPNKQLSMNGGYLRLTDLPPRRGRHVSIDLFFRALARVHQERAVGIVLSGTGSDGAVGLVSLKEHGGVAIAQSPMGAEYDGMPQSAIATGVLEAFRHLLALEGAEVTGARSGAEALVRAEAADFDRCCRTSPCRAWTATS